MILMTPGGKLIRSGEIETGRLIRLFSVSFGYALIFAAIFEEFFFRAVLQSRLAKALNSELSGLLIASFLFGLYHLPFQYYGDGAASGDLGFSLSTVLNEQMISGPFLGILWLRTKNLFAPIMVHALIDAISLMPQLV